MSIITISIHEALAKLKLYDQKLTSLISRAPLTVATIRNNDSVISGKTKKAFKEDAESFVKSYNALLGNKLSLREAIVQSNASTFVNCGTNENPDITTVAGAIEKKNAYARYHKVLTNILITQLNQAREVFNRADNNFQNNFENFLSSMGDKSKYKSEEIEALRDTYEKSNGVTLYDPIGLEKLINKRNEEYEDFMATIDFRLSESNASTKITIDFVD